MVICLILQGDVNSPSGMDDHVIDDEFNFDIGFDEYHQDSLDRHWKVMTKTFRSLGEAYTFYNQYAKDRAFSVGKDLQKFSKGPEGGRRLRRYLCTRELENDRQNYVQWKAGPAGLEGRVDASAMQI